MRYLNPHLKLSITDCSARVIASIAIPLYIVRKLLTVDTCIVTSRPYSS